MEESNVTTTDTESPWTDEDVAWLADALTNVGRGAMPEKHRRHDADAILAALAPRVAALVRAGQAEALREAADCDGGGCLDLHRSRMTDTESPWTDEDVEVGTLALHQLVCVAPLFGQECVRGDDDNPAATCSSEPRPDDAEHGMTRAVLDALAPRVAALVRAGQVEALHQAGDRDRMPCDVQAFVTAADQREIAQYLDGLADEIERGER